MAIPNPRNTFGEYTWVWDAICWVSAGEAWPSGDEDRMRELADAWQALADTVSETLGQADPAVMRILQSWGGGAGEAFGGLWNQIGVDPNTGLPLIQEISAAYAAGCDQAALEIEYAKLTVLIAVIITVIAVFVALLMAWLGGVSAGAIPGILAGGRQAVTIAFRRLIAQMGRQLLTRAGMRAALRLAGTRLGQMATSQSFRRGLNRLGRELVEEIGEELIIDVGAQAYQMHTGTRRQWDGNRTLTAGVGGAYGAVLGTGMNWAGRRAAPRMPFSFSPSQLSFRGSGVVRWGSTSLASGAQNAVISPAASVLANGTINGQWAMPGADAFLGGFTSGAGRTGATLAGGATGNLMARGTNALLGRPGLDVAPNAGPVGGADPGVGVGDAGGLGDLGEGANGAGAGSTGGGSTSGAGATGGGTGSASDGGSAGSGANSGASVGGTGSDAAGTSNGAGGTTGAGATDTGNGAAQNGAGTVPDSGAGSISLAPPSADGSVAPTNDGSGASVVDGGVPTGDTATVADPSRVDGSTGIPVGVPGDVAATTPDGTPAVSDGVGDGATVSNDQTGGPEGRGAPVTESPGTDGTNTNTDTGVNGRATSDAPVQTDGGPVAGRPADVTVAPPGDGSTGSGRTVTDSPVSGVTDGGPVDTAPSVTADVAPSVLPGTTTAPVTASPTAPAVGTPPSATVTPTGPTVATNPTPTTGTPATTNPQVASTPNASTPTTAGTPTTGTSTQQPAGNTATQPTPGRGTPVGPVVNPAAAHTAGSISLTPAAGPTTTNPVQPTGSTPQVASPQQPGTAPQATPAQPAQPTPRPDTTAAPANPLAPSVPAQTAGIESTTPSLDATPTADPETNPNPDRTDPAQRTTDGPVVVPVPTSSGTLQGGPTNPGPETATGPVDPQTLKRSEGPTGRGTHSWQLAPTSVDPNSPEAERALIEASRTLAETVRREVKAGTISKGKQPGMAGALLMPDGSITTHTSMTADRGTKPPTQPRVHPLAQAALDRIAATLVDGVGGGHGKCAEVALVSDQLYLLEQQWRNAGEPGTFEQYASDSLQGAKIVTHQVKPARSDGVTYELGHYRPPCRSCAHFLPQFNVEPITDSDRDVSGYQPSVAGTVGNGPPLSGSRPYGQPEGLVPPDPRDQQALEDAVPSDEATGRPLVHPDPRGPWTGLINDGGPTVPGRDTNCADVGLSVLSTWFGRPEVAAPTAPSTAVEAGSTARQEQALGASFAHQGTGATALDAVAEALRAAGPGSAALIVTSWNDGTGAHTWNAVNHNGTIIWLDGQNQMISDTSPLHAGRVDGVWSIVLDAEGDPVSNAVPEVSVPAPVPPASTADVPTDSRNQNTTPTGRPGAVADPSNPDRTPGDPNKTDETPAAPNNPADVPAGPNDSDAMPADSSDSDMTPGGPDPENDPGPGAESVPDANADVNPAPAAWPDMQGWPMPDTRQFGPEQLAPLEDPQYQDDVEGSLRTLDGYEVFADPSTHPYGQLINDGGPDQPGRANNCVDTILAALASFYGDPQVSYPRWPDQLDDGTVETALGELDGFGRIESWIGGEWTGDNDALPGTPAERSAALADQFEQLYQRVRDAGPGAAAVVAVDWIQFDENTGDPLLDAEGNTQAAGEHVFLLVYPQGADGPVWWDPQFGSTTTDPLPGDYVGLTHNLWSMEVQPAHADEQGGSPATDDHAAGDGQPGSGVPVRVRLGSPGDALPAAADTGPATGPGGLHHRPDGSGDRASQPATTVDHETVRGGPTGGPDHRPAGLAGPGSDGLNDAGSAPDGDPAASPYLDGLPDTDQATLLDALTDAQTDADQILADLHSLNAEVNAQLGLTGADALSTLGEQHRVKSAESLARKFRTELEPLGYDIGSALDTVNDVVRFSVRGPESEAYGPAVAALLASLEAQDYQVTDLKNFWHPGNRFFGLNCTLTAPSGRTFELQFPTDTSYNVGKQTHDQYEVMRDPAQSPAARVHAFLDILAVNKANGIAASMPGGMDSARFDTPKDTSFAKWMASPRQASIRESYLDWLGQQGLTFADVLAARGLAASDLPGLDPDLMGGVHGTTDVRLLPPPETGRSGRPAGKPDRGGGQHRADPGGDLGSAEASVDVPARRGSGDPVGESGTPRDPAGRPGDGRAPGGALRDGAVADGGRADGDLPLGGLTAEVPGARNGPEVLGDAGPGSPEAPGVASSVPLDTDHGLAQTRRLGPGELAPLEDPGHQWDVEQSLRTPDGYVLFADPSTHPYGQLVNDGGPSQPGRANNCLDSALSALSSFFGDPRVSFPRWPDVRPDGSIETVTGEASGLDRAEEWLGVDWSGGSEGLPTNPAEHAAAVAEQYAQLHQRVAAAGPGAAALVVAEWVRTDSRTGELVLDRGQVQVQDSHAFVVVFPEGADGPIWWDPQRGTTWPLPPAAYLSQTYALWSMETTAERVSDDGGRGADADQTPAGHGERDRAASVRVRLAGEGAAVTTGTGGGQATGPRELHHRPDGSDHSPDESAGTAADHGVHAGPPRGPDDGSTGLADGGSDGLTPPVGTAGDAAPSGVDGPPLPPGDSRPATDPDGPDLWRAAAGTTFGGGLLDADPGRTAIAVEAALTTGPLPDGASADPATATVTLTTLDGPYPVRVELTPVASAASVAPVAAIRYTTDGAVVQVSTSAHPDHVRRAVAAVLAEVDTIAQQRAEGLRLDATTALAEGARPEGDGTRVLTAGDIGRLAELRVVLADSSAATDPGAAGQLRAEALSLLVASGLLEQEPAHLVHGLGSNTPVVGPEAARARLDLIHHHLGPLAAEVESLIGLAQSDGRQLVADIRAAQSAIRAEARAWAQQATELRDQADLALTARVDATLGVAPDHVFDRLVIGGGWAATADFVTMGAAADAGHGLPPVLCISQGHDPWAERQALLMGQIPSELELPGLPFQPGDLAEEGTQFTPSDVFADAVGAARALSGMPTYQGTATSIAPRPADATGWPDGANFRVTVNGRDIYTTSVDIASGPGPSRVPSVPADVTGRYVDPTTGYRVDRSASAALFQDPDGNPIAPERLPPPVRAVLGGPGTSRSDLPLLADLTGRPTDPLVVDPTSGYAVDVTTGQVLDPDGTQVDAGAVPAEVGARLGFAPDGSFSDPRPSVPPVDFGGQNLADAYRPGDRVLVFGAGASGAWDIEQAVASAAASVDWSARAMDPPPDQLTGDPVQDAEARLRHSFGGGYNRRNTLPDIGAYSDTVQSQVDRSLREIVSLRHTVEGGFLVEFTDGSRQTYDRVVLSIGQAAEFPGGVAGLLPDLALAPIEGPATDPLGVADVLGFHDGTGQLRVLGAASVAGPVLGRVDETVEDAIRRQAGALPADSRGIAPSIRFHAQRIAEANRPAPATPGDGSTTPGSPSGPDASHLLPTDTEPAPSPLDVEPGQSSVPGDQFLPERGHLDGRGLAVDVLSVAPGGDLDGVTSQVDVAQSGKVTGGGQGLGPSPTDAAARQTQPAEPTQVRRVDEDGEPVVADRIPPQVEGDQAVEVADLGDVRHESGGLDQDQVADGMTRPDLPAVGDEGAGGHGDGLDQTVADLPVDEQVVDAGGEPLTNPPVQEHRLPGVADPGEVEADQLGVLGVDGLDGVGVASPQVEVVGVGEDGGVEVGGRGHDGSVSTDGAVTTTPAPSLPESRRFGPAELAPLEDPRFQDDLAASLETPQGYAIFADPSTHPYGRLINDGGPEQPGRSNNCIDSSLAALASFHGNPQVSVPRWADQFDDGLIDRVTGERGGPERAEAWIGGQWIGGPGNLPTDPPARTDAVAAQYADLYQQVANAGPGASALVVADWLLLDAAGNVMLDGTGRPEVDSSHAFVIVFPAGADAPVWWDPQTGTTSVEMPAADVRETHALWAMMVPDGEGRVDRGRGADADQPTAADRESDHALGVRVRLAGPGETLGAGADLGDARGPGQLHHRPVGSDHSALQPAAPSADGGVRAGTTRGQDQGPAGVARGGPDRLTQPDEAAGDVALPDDSRGIPPSIRFHAQRIAEANRGVPPRLPGTVGPGQVETDQLGAFRVGGLDGVGVTSPQVEVVRVGEDGGVEVGGRGHDASVSTGDSITAGAVPGSSFHGLGRPVADPAAVLDLARSVLPQVAPYAQVDAVVAVGPELFEIRSAGQHPLTVRLTSEPLADGLVARSHRDPDGAFTVTVSDRAADQVVARALAHEVAELVALHESGRALVGPLDPGNIHGPIDPAGLTAHDRGRMAEIRLLAATYAADPVARPAMRAEIDALAGHLGLRVGDPDVRSRWALLPRDVLAHLMQLSVPLITPDAVSTVLAGAATLTEVERIRMIDYRARLAPDFQVPQQPDLDARLRDLATEAEHAQSGMPRMPAFAGQIVGIPQAHLNRIRAVDPQLADRLAAEGIYVDLTGRYDLRPYMVPSVPAVDLGAARPAFDLTTEAGRRAQLHEDRQRARAALRGLRGDQAAALLTGHDFHYQGSARWMGLVPDVLTEALRSITPAPTATVENSPVQQAPGEIRVAADRVTLPPESAGQPGPVYGPALDARTGQPPPLFDGPPKREDVQQGALGDCGMIAVIGSVAGQLPDTVAQMFHLNPDGSVDVLLHETSGPDRVITPTGRQLRVTVFPDVPLHPNSNGHSAYADQSVVGASWASLLEKAIAAIDRSWTQQRHDQWQQQWTARPGVDAAQAAPLGYARLDNGSSRLVQAELLSQLTGLPTGVSELDPTPGREADAEARLAGLLAAGSPLITGTLPASAYAAQPGGKPPYGLVAGHAYEIVSVANGEVQLRNPWNSRHPAPMPLRAFLDLMSPWYAHVEPARSTVAALPGSEFHGQGRPAADAPAVLDRSRTVLPALAETVGADQIVAVGPDVFELRTPGLEPLRVRVSAAALASGVVAQTIRNLDGTFTLTVSDRASDPAVDRAVTHEAAELLARHESGIAQVGLFDQGAAEGPIDPAGLSVRDRGRLAELRLTAAWYAQADSASRLALRAEIDTLVDRLGLRWGTPDAAARLAVLPADVWTQVMQLSLPMITPEAVAGALADNPNQTLVERFRAIDYRSRLDPDLQPPPAADLAAKLRELAVHGEQSQSSLPRMPALAGQLIGLPQNLLDQVRRVDPSLADRLATEGIYVDLTGRFDLRPYTLDGAPEFNLERSAPAYDLNTPAGRHALLTEDRARAHAAFNVEYGSNPAAMAVLATHSFHYQSDARRMALVPRALTEALRAMMPPEPSVETEVIPTVTTGEIALVADRVTLPDPDPEFPVEYGRALLSATGKPAPLHDGTPRRTQVQQGVLGDCGMLATMAALAGHRPESIPQLFQPRPDGTVDVLLHESVLRGDESSATGRRIRINVRPDVPVHAGSSWAAYADQSEVGVGWAAVLEKALAAVDRTWTTERHEHWQCEWRGWESKDDPHRAAPVGYARLNVGSTPLMQAELLTQLTGLPARQTPLDTRPGREAEAERHLAALLAAGSPITIATWPKESYPGLAVVPYGMKAKHVYEIVAVQNGHVQLRNPWNTEHPSPMPLRAMLDLMGPWCAHLEQSAAVALPSPAADGGPAANVEPPVPSPRSSDEQIVDRPLAVSSPASPLIKQHGPPAKPASPRTLGRTHLDDERYLISYFALLAGGGSVAGLMVSEVGGPGRSLHWAAGGVVSGQATPVPVGRAEAERIARDVLGFVLPAEPALYDMLNT
ncbi:toxin glutamine deamidase domain-containing protein [Verrucosispora sp. WMMD573]|uniref:toxin glutamine deamidase domain-containing protein n=1 Tax=Verrucosispora sp. WMMD573 TaxID=3015149 RepID=UPI00248CB607|nr:toxin glutamine deamidase domain-containing protein [Verrucosispora sp. WMMD573]WBB55548.1 toxin glutamine deamidase domain-containing protein [Verrucosispora sp. WMMD573]